MASLRNALDQHAAVAEQPMQFSTAAAGEGVPSILVPAVWSLLVVLHIILIIVVRLVDLCQFCDPTTISYLCNCLT